MLFCWLAMLAFYNLYKRYQMQKRLLVTNVQYIYYPPEVKIVFGVGSIPVAILPSCRDMKTIALQ